MQTIRSFLTAVLRVTGMSLLFLLHYLGVLHVIRYLLMAVALGLCVILFRVLNRTTVVRIGQGRLKPKVLIVSNHQSLIDSFLVGYVLGFPQLLYQPWLMPWHLADAENFFTHPVLKYVYRLLKAIPVKRGGNGERQDLDAFQAAMKALKRGALHIFIEGSRSRDEELLRPKRGPAGLAILTEASVLPVHLTGMHEVQPYRKAPGDPPRTWLRAFGKRTEWLLDVRVGKRISIVVGEKLSPQEVARLAGRGKLHERSRRLADALMARIRSLKEEIELDRLPSSAS